MTPAQEGGYIRLLAWCWKDDDCSLPADVDALARLSRLQRRLRPSLLKVLEQFQKHPSRTDRLTHPRLWEIFQEYQEYREKARERGKKGAQARWGTPSPSNGASTAQAMLGDSSSPSPSQLTQPRDPCTQDSIVTPAQEASTLERSRTEGKYPYPHTQVCYECGHRWALHPGRNGTAPFYGHGAAGGPTGCRATCAAPVYEDHAASAQARKALSAKPKPKPKCPQCGEREPKAGDCLCAECLSEARK